MMNFFMPIIISISLMSCSTNVYESLVTDENDAALLEKAANQIDDKQYVQAQATLEKVEGDSNHRRILGVASALGAVGFDIWQLILGVLDTKQGSKQIGFDNIFDALSTAVFGDQERAARIDAIATSIESLLNAPDPSDPDLKNLNCFLGGILSIVAVEDASTGISTVKSSLETVQSGVTNGGESDADCPGVDDLQASLVSLGQAQVNLSLVLQATSNCSFIDPESSSLNTVEAKLNTFTTNGDKGCSANPDCGSSEACQALQYSCVQSRVYDSTSEADDGTVSSCEIVQNCLGSTCF